MKQEIEKIMEFVTATIHPKNAGKLDLSETGLRSLLATVSNAIENLRIQLVNSVFNFDKQTDAEFLVQNYQSAIITLLDDLSVFQLIQSEKDLVELYTAISIFLSDFLSYIEKYFSKYFNLEENLPVVYYSLIAKDFEEQLNKLSVLLRERAAAQQLIDIIFFPFSKFKSNQGKSLITYRYLIYLKELLNELNDICQNKKEEDLNIVIRSRFIYLNFNDPVFLSLIINTISNETNSQQSLQEKVLKLKFYKKEINQIHTRPGAALHKDIMPIKEQLIVWIDEEINFLQIENDVLKQSSSIPEQQSDRELKINTSLSVPQLAYFIRLLVENKTITNINQTQILKFFTLHFTSLKREHISYGHLRSQYYKTELPAIESIKNLLLTLVNLSRKIK